MKQEKFLAKTFRITKENDKFIKQFCKSFKVGESQFLRDLLTRQKLAIPLK